MVYTIIIKKPLITERSLEEAKKGIFVFEVDRKAEKFQIKRSVEKMYNVHVKDISTNIVKGKKRVFGKKRTKVTRPDRKKAYVRLEKGEKIAVFESAS